MARARNAVEQIDVLKLKLLLLGERYTCMCMSVRCSLLLHYFVGMSEPEDSCLKFSRSSHYASGNKYKAIMN